MLKTHLTPCVCELSVAINRVEICKRSFKCDGEERKFKSCVVEGM